MDAAQEDARMRGFKAMMAEQLGITTLDQPRKDAQVKSAPVTGSEAALPSA